MLLLSISTHITGGLRTLGMRPRSPGLVTTLSQGWHIQTDHSQSNSSQVFVLWEEIGALGGNPHRYVEKMQTPDRENPVSQIWIQDHLAFRRCTSISPTFNYFVGKSCSCWYQWTFFLHVHRTYLIELSQISQTVCCADKTLKEKQPSICKKSEIHF